MTIFIINILLAYLLGSVSGSLFLGKLKDVDIRDMGSGNAGGTNAFRTQGALFALGVIIIDVGKGVIAALWVPYLGLGGSEELLIHIPATAGEVMLCGFAAMLGHCFPIWHGFRGGKGAATAIGAMMIIEPWLLLPLAVVWLVSMVMSGYVGLSTVLAGFSLIPSAWWLDGRELVIFTTATALFLMFTHRRNLRHMSEGTENRFERMQLFFRKH
jgi:glycerol-3-phosphate acyltransferase PlsY